MRDQEPSGFSPALQRLCESTAGLSAALVDSGGETVDYAGVLDPFETRVAAAEWGLILRTLKGTRELDRTDTAELYFRGRRRSFTVIPLSQGYALVIETPACSLFLSKRAVVQAVHDISTEAGLALPETWLTVRERWTRVNVRFDRRFRRPTALWRSGEWQTLHVMGRMTRDQLGRSEAGYRVRAADGAEITLVREPLNRWYMEEVFELACPTNTQARTAGNEAKKRELHE